MLLLATFGCMSSKPEIRVYIPEDYFWTNFDTLTNDASTTYWKDYKYDDSIESKRAFNFMEELFETTFSDNACIIYSRENNVVIIRGLPNEVSKLETIFEAGESKAYKKRLKYVE